MRQKKQNKSGSQIRKRYQIQALKRMRKLEYTVSEQDGSLVVRQVMKEKFRLSDKEISHAKHFEDGILGCLDLNLGGMERKRLHKDIYEAEIGRENRIETSENITYQKDNGESGEKTEKEKRISEKNATGIYRRTCTASYIKVRVNETLYPGEKLTVTLHEMEDDRGRIIPVPGPIDIIYEDEDLIVLNKPAGVVAHPSPGHTDDSLSNCLAYYYETKNDPHRIRIIGRLDQEASGVLLFAKTRMAARALRREGAYDKEYLAVCSGFFSKEEESGTIKFPILKRPEVILKREINPDGEEAVTHYQVLLQGKGMALVRLTLETGRTHQIRLHMQTIGHPLIGDRIYGLACAVVGIGDCQVHRSRHFHAEEQATMRQDLTPHNLQTLSTLQAEETSEAKQESFTVPTHAMLHAEKMHITHPVTGKKMTFTAEIPEDMETMIAQIKMQRLS